MTAEYITGLVPEVWKVYKFNLKSAKDDGTVSGYASVFGVVDSDDEVMQKGCFKRTVNASKGVMPVLWGHDRSTPIGWGTKAEEDDHGLYVEAKLMLDTEIGRMAFAYVRDGLAVGGKPGISVGFRVTKDGAKVIDGRKTFVDVQLMEWSIVVFQACPGAVAEGAKGALPFGDLPIAEVEQEWDAENAKEAIAKWAGGPEEENVDWAKYRKGFFWFDVDNKNSFDGYKIPFATVVDGKLVAVPRGIDAAVGSMKSEEIPAEAQEKIKNVVGRYFKKMKKDSPFAKGEVEGGSMKEQFEFKSNDFTSQLATSQALDGHYDLRWKADQALRQVIDNVCENDDLKLAEKKPLVSKALDGHCEFMKSWYSQLLDISYPDDPEEEEQELAAALELLGKGGAISLTAKQGAAISAKTKAMLSKCMSLIKESMGHSKASGALKTKALGHLADLATGRYFNDVNSPNPVGGGATTPPAPVTGSPVGGGKSDQELHEEKLLEEIAGSLKKFS